MTYFLIGCVLGLIIGVVLGAFVVNQFDIVNSEYTIDKLRAKKGGKINVEQLNKDIKQPKKRLLKRIFTKNK